MEKGKIAFLLALLISMLGTNASAHDIEVANGGVTIYYKFINNNTELAVSFRGSGANEYIGEYSGNVAIPATVTYNGTSYSVSSIGNYAFSRCSGLTSITIPSSVTSIGHLAFSDCSGLTSITIPSSVTSIGFGAFYGCSGLKSIDIPNSVTSIGIRAFEGCSGLTNVTIPNSVTSIGNFAFSECSSLTSINIPNSVTSIGDCAFFGCSGLTSPVYTSTIFAFLPESFSGPYIIPDGIKEICGGAFSGCSSLTSVTIPKSVTSIGDWAFENCSGLTSVHISDIAAWCDISFGNFFSNPLSCAHHLFLGDNEIKDLVIPNSVTSIGDMSFYDCSGLTSVTIPNSVTSIGEDAFACCTDLTSITIPNSVTSIGMDAFGDCSGLTFVTIHAGVTSIGEVAFAYTGLTSIAIPSSVTSIGGSAFSGCSGLTSIDIPSSVTSIGGDAFNGTAWYNNQPNGLIYAGKVAYKYKGTMPSNTSIALKDGTSEIAGYAFSGCSGLTSIDIPSSVTSIGGSAFSGCSGLTSIDIPSSVTSIGGCAFSGCSGLTSIDIPSSVTSIGGDAFNGTAWYNNQPDGLIYAGKVAYTYKGTMPSNTSIYLKDGTSEIAGNAFSGCSGLTSITIPSSVTSIGNHAFDSCTGLTSITIPNSVTCIGDYAFADCNDLMLGSVKVEREAPVNIQSNTFFNRNDVTPTFYVPQGCKSAYQAARYWKNFKAIKEFPDPDVNQDGETDVVDVVDIARYVVATPRESFEVFLADLNSDRAVNVADAVVLVNDIAGDTNWSRSMLAPQGSRNDVLTLTESSDHSLSLQLEGDGRYTAFQFDLLLPAGMDVMQMKLNSQRKQGQQLLFNKVDEDRYRVVALSTSNREFSGVSGELLNIVPDGFAADGIVVENIHFITPQGADVPFEAIGLSKEGAATGISSISEDSDAQQEVYNLKGQRLASPQKGLNITKGKKIMMK